MKKSIKIAVIIAALGLGAVTMYNNSVIKTQTPETINKPFVENVADPSSDAGAVNNHDKALSETEDSAMSEGAREEVKEKTEEALGLWHGHKLSQLIHYPDPGAPDDPTEPVRFLTIPQEKRGATICLITSPCTGIMEVHWDNQLIDNTGYYLQYSTTSDFSSGNHSETIPDKTILSKTFSNLNSESIYYVRILTYKDEGLKGWNCYSGWSDIQSVKVS